MLDIIDSALLFNIEPVSYLYSLF